VKAEKFRELDAEELQSKVSELREAIFRFRVQMATGQLDQPQKIQASRKDLARALTVLAEKQAELNRAEEGEHA
jgi:large subunit ribosomal protein L29